MVSPAGFRNLYLVAWLTVALAGADCSSSAGSATDGAQPDGDPATDIAVEVSAADGMPADDTSTPDALDAPDAPDDAPQDLAAVDSPTDQAQAETETGPARAPRRHRVTAQTCPPLPPTSKGDAGPDVTPDPFDPPPPECQSDDQCGAGKVCGCSIDCLPTFIGGTNICLPSTCKVDTDCGPNGFCSPSLLPGLTNCIHRTDHGYFCHTPNDECLDDSDCAGRDEHHAFCLYATDRWVCSATF